MPPTPRPRATNRQSPKPRPVALPAASSTLASDYYPTVHIVAGRALWRVYRRASIFTGCRPTVVWSGINKDSCRRALLEFRERERYNTAHWPHVAEGGDA